MAIVIDELKRYYRIAFDECKIMGLTVYAAVYEYATKEDRDKEKVRRPQITTFIDTIQQKATALYQEISSAFETMGKEPQEVTDAEGMILANEYPELRAKQDELMRIQDWPQIIHEHCYRFGTGEPQAFDFATIMAELKYYGFVEDWVTDPIRITGHGEFNCGDYHGEELTTEFYYERLKPLLVGDYTNC